MGSSILLLQEVQSLEAGRLLNGGAFFGGKPSFPAGAGSFVTSNCGIVIPPSLSSAVLDYTQGPYWCGVFLLNGLDLISDHLLWGMNENADSIITDPC